MNVTHAVRGCVQSLLCVLCNFFQWLLPYVLEVLEQDVSGHRDPVVSRCIQNFNLLYTGAHTDTDACEILQLHVMSKFKRSVPNNIYYCEDHLRGDLSY